MDGVILKVSFSLQALNDGEI